MTMVLWSLSDFERNPMTNVITVWSDLGCPWATLALHTLHAAANRRGVALNIDHRAFPLELFNRRATPKTVIDAEIVAIAGLFPELGWRRWPSAASTYPVTTVPAMAAVQAAKNTHIGGFAGSDELDAALRRAFYREGRCISIHSEIVDIAAECRSVDDQALAEALGRGAGLHEVHQQWRTARQRSIVGSPHMFAGISSATLHNPGVDYHWTAPPDDGGVPRFVSYDPAWADDLLATLNKPTTDGRE